MGKNTNRAKISRKALVELKAIWEINGFEWKPSNSVNVLARELSERLNITLVPGHKMYVSVLAHCRGLPSPEPKYRQRRASGSKPAPPTKDKKAAFYASWEWRKLRTQVIEQYGKVCMCCGSNPSHKDMAGNPVRIVVDHIKPLHHHWELRLQRDNLQVLCDECNQGKGAWNETDHRPAPVSDEWVLEDDMPASIKEQLEAPPW